MAHPGNAAPQKTTDETIEEPSMDDIMASIRQIIAEDEQASSDGLTERERYTHPDNPSNVNDPDAALPEAAAVISDDELMSAMEVEMQAAVEEEVSTQMEAPVLEHAEISAPEPADDLDDDGDGSSESIVAGTIAGAGLAAATQGLQERAEQVRAEMGLSSVDAHGLTLEQRLEKYRVRNRQNEEAQKEAEEKLAAERKAEAEAMKRIADAIPPQAAQSVDAADVAKSLMDQTQGTLSADMAEMMRPIVREWLSENLSGIVERLVREEIERVSRGRKIG